jgi:branched-chain amino acid transport system permease protein
MLLAGQALLLATIATSWNLVAGYLGQIDLGHVAYFGLGAYGTGLAMTVLGQNLAAGLAAGVVLAIGVAALVGMAVLRLHGPTFALATLGVLVGIREIIRVAEPVTGGGRGLVLPVLNPTAFVVAASVLFAVAVAVSWQLRHGAVWPILLAVRHDERAAAARGIPTMAWKHLVFVTAAAVTGAAGGLWAFQSTFVDPDLAFADGRGLDMITGALLGGLGTVIGPVVGALVLFAGRAVPWLPADPYVVLIQGLILIAVVRWMPRGLLGGVSGERAVEDLLGGLAGRSQPVPRDAAADLTDHGMSADRRGRSAGPGGPVLEARGLRVRRSGADILDGVDLTVGEGEILGVIGPNGSGKSTLADCLGRLQPVDGGTITLAGRDVTGESAPRVARAGLARTFQTPRVYPDLTVLENLVSSGRWTLTGARRLDPSHQERAAALLSELGLSDRGATPAGELTLGDQRLLELGMARMLEPRVLVLDEATAGVASGPVSTVKATARACADSGVAVIVIEHDIGVVADLCDRVVILNHGRIVAEGTPASIVESEAIETAYFGTADGGVGAHGVE